MKKTFCFIIFVYFMACPLTASAKAYFAPKGEMISKSDVIAIVEIVDIRKLDEDKMHSDMRVTAKRLQILKGKADNFFEFFVPNFFPCAIVTLEKGRYLVFLEAEGLQLQGSNWRLSYRPVLNNKLEWYKNDMDAELEEADLDEVLDQIKNVINEDQNMYVCPVGKMRFIDHIKGWFRKKAN